MKTLLSLLLTLALQKAVREADLVLVPADNLVAMTLPTLIETCQANGKPLVATYSLKGDEGAAASIGISYSQMGQEAAQIAFKLLEGQSPSSIGHRSLTPKLQVASTVAPSKAVR